MGHRAAVSGAFGNFERRFGWLAFPGLLRHIALLHVLVFVVQMFRPDIGDLFAFDRGKILAGEVWRLVTCFFAASPFGTPSIVNILLLFFAVNFAFMVSEGIEAAWGVWRTSMFCYLGLFTILLAHLLLPGVPRESGLVLYASAFFAFTTLHPKVEILLFLFLPVRVAVLGIIQAVLLLIMAVSSPVLFPFFLITLLNYALFSGIPALRNRAGQVEAVQRRREFREAAVPTASAFHSCVLCDRTEETHPELDFRVGSDGCEYCEDHLPG